jgi:hypothetical protein
MRSSGSSGLPLDLARSLEHRTQARIAQLAWQGHSHSSMHSSNTAYAVLVHLLAWVHRC